MSLLSKKILFASLVFALAGFMLWRFLPRLPGRTPIAQREFTDELVAGRPIKVIGPDHATIFLVGDIMLSRNVAAAIADQGGTGSRAKTPNAEVQPVKGGMPYGIPVDERTFPSERTLLSSNSI